MLEIEIKSRSEDNDAVERRLLELGAKALGELDQLDEYYNHPVRDFGVTDEALRLRRDVGGRITYKGPRIDRVTKTREEIELGIDDLEKMGEILARLGFRRVARVHKIRKEYELDGVVVSLDSVDGLGDYVEVEVQGEDPEEGRMRIECLRQKLGLQGNETRSYLEMLLEIP